MKLSAIKIPEDLLMRLNRIKYQWGYKTQGEVIRRLIEIASKFQSAEDYIQAASPEVKAKGKKLAVSGKTNRARGSPDIKEEK